MKRVIKSSYTDSSFNVRSMNSGYSFKIMAPWAKFKPYMHLKRANKRTRSVDITEFQLAEHDATSRAIILFGTYRDAEDFANQFMQLPSFKDNDEVKVKIVEYQTSGQVVEVNDLIDEIDSHHSHLDFESIPMYIDADILEYWLEDDSLPY